MAKSLQDQLLKAGLANNKQATKAKKAKNTREKMQRKGAEIEDETGKLVDEAQAAKLEKDRELNRQRDAIAQQKAIQAQIKQLVELNRIAARGEIEYSFSDEGKIKTLYIEPAQKQALTNGQIAIVKTSNSPYEMVHATIAQKIAERDASVLKLLNEKSSEEEIDDEYADYQIPDDLMW